MNRYEPYDALTQNRPPRRRRLWLWIPLVVVVSAFVFAAVFFFRIAAFMATGFPTPPPTTVSTATARFEEWAAEIQAVGSLKPVRGADLSVEVPGVVDEVNFESGGDVAAGATLMRLRDADDVAKLRTLEAARDLAQTNFARDQMQLQRMLISQAAFDTAAANLRSAQAQVAEQQAIVAKKTVKAPFAGHLGIRNVNAGQYVAPGTSIATLQALDPIYVDFFLPQQVIDQIKVGLAVTLKVDAYPDATFTGRIATIDPKVDPATRNVAIRASLPNASRRLLPGMFATVVITTGTSERHITLPQTAILFNPYGNVVYLVQKKTDEAGKEALTVTQSVVTTGDTRGDQVAVLSGLKEGDVVVSAGQNKLQNGAAISVNNTIMPSNDPNPRPVER